MYSNDINNFSIGYFGNNKFLGDNYFYYLEKEKNIKYKKNDRLKRKKWKVILNSLKRNY